VVKRQKAPRIPGEIVLTIGVTSLASIQGVKVTGKVFNVAAEWPTGNRTVRLTSLSTGGAIETPLNADNTFEFAKVPADVYLTSLAGFTRGFSVFPTVTVVNSEIGDVAIDLKNNPFPEYPGGSYTPIFSEKRLTTQGILTTVPIAIGPTVSYFRMEVRDDNTGIVTPWAVMLTTRLSPARLAEILHLKVGVTVTVVGTSSSDGSNRMSIDTRDRRGTAPNSINGVAVPNDETTRDETQQQQPARP
jgi:hypothetical protein